ncbi:MAG: prepilin peptidase [Candidatus Kerfeldbacteria bacterium]|nr:prepilin peptidase [Candidatus Kerfeldbacteria bacterium]
MTVPGGWWTLITVALFGAAVGSFLNVVVLRTHEGRSYWSGRSACPHCHRPLRWFELIPIFSYLFLRGQCRRCGKILSTQYLIVELVTAGAFLLVLLINGVSLTLLVGWLVAAVMILLAVYDARWSLLPDTFSFLFILLALADSLVHQRSIVSLAYGGLAGVVFFSLQYALSRGRWIGSGDILLGLGLGLLLGWQALALALLMAYTFGSLVAALKLARRRANLRSAMAFGPYLLGAGFIAWLWGPTIIHWYVQQTISF